MAEGERRNVSKEEHMVEKFSRSGGTCGKRKRQQPLIRTGKEVPVSLGQERWWARDA